MKVGLIPVNIGIADPARMIGLAQLAERAGFESVWTFEHVIVPLDYQSKYPYNDTGKMGADPDTSVVDSWGYAHEVPNLVVAGASCFPNGGGLNPTETAMTSTRAIDD